MKIKFLIFIILNFMFLTSQLFSKEQKPCFWERPAGDISEKGCNTSSQYSPDLTRITFYGDSRLDYADEPVTGGKNLLWYINNGIDGSDSSNVPNFGIQNFGQSTWIADQLNGHLFTCLGNLSRCRITKPAGQS
ncbi:MAG: hypothetical protein L6Q54_08800 [Leptospiraceae bacterium]|nr:hypothetical protein [Leptospiraceae bacterium]MCK6381332.1 hypothetical protein [Leptospiraceae bacterium]NUM42767.1 hypothetical protein [Leptospiraceae bacterium]